MTYNTEHLVIYIILDESVTAYLETHLNGRYTIRHRTCSILIEDGERCSSCKQHRKSLHAMASRLIKVQSNECRTTPDSHVNYRYLTSSEKNERLSHLHQVNKASKRRIAILEKKL